MKTIASFSGGRTSAYMTIRLKEQCPDLIVIFANTGQEREETLDFVNRCDQYFKLNVIWLESVTYPLERSGCGYQVTSYKKADRNGIVFENMIKKYGIPNKAYPHCTRELKANPIKKWIKENVYGEYRMAIGIRIDEQNRKSNKAEQDKLFYPLIDWEISKIDVNDFWAEQNFNLGLRDYQGNCKFCFKKSNNKLLTIARENPEFFKFPAMAEKIYGLNGHNVDGTKRVFFRGNRSTEELLSLSSLLTDEDLEDFRKSIDPDATSPCSESCEAFGDEQIAF